MGFREAMTNPTYQTSGSKLGVTPKLIAGGLAASFAAACAFGTKLGLDVHTPFLGGVGNLAEDVKLSLPFGECINANIRNIFQKKRYWCHVFDMELQTN